MLLGDEPAVAPAVELEQAVRRRMAGLPDAATDLRRWPRLFVI